MNRQQPFADTLLVALLGGGGRRLLIIANKLAEKAEQGDLQPIREIADRWTEVRAGNTARRPMEALSDRELFAIIRGGPARTV